MVINSDVHKLALLIYSKRAIMFSAKIGLELIVQNTDNLEKLCLYCKLKFN